MPLDITESQMACIAQEGGVDLINYLLAKAIADNGLLPNMSSPREWTFHDILHMHAYRAAKEMEESLL